MNNEINKTPLVSVIVPVYNTAEYLRQCLDSIVMQTYKNLEIILVDDGSNDGSEKIVDEYANKDRRIKVIHKENGGESSARNVGLRLVSGQYVGFVDCDDWLDKEMYEVLLKHALEKNADFVASSWYKESKSQSDTIKNDLAVSSPIISREELLNYIYQRDSYRGFAYMWNKLYKRQLLYDEKTYELILFDDDLRLGGDVIYLARLALNTNRAYYVDKAFYHYRQRENSGSHTTNLELRLDWLEAYNRVITYIESNHVETQALIWIKRFLVYHSSNVAELAYRQRNKDILIYCQNIMKKYQDEYFITNTNSKDRIERYYAVLKLCL